MLELVLQLASYVVYRSHSRNVVTAGTEGGSTVLCIGDSYTYGVGASSPDSTYPAALGKAIEDRTGAAPTLINAGWPGLNSRDLLSRIDSQLERFDPDLVFILVGLNDVWSRPARLTLGADSIEQAEQPGTHWRWRWRTRRLMLWILAGGNPSAPAAAPTTSPESSAQPSPRNPGGGGDDFGRAFQYLVAGRHEAAAAAFEDALVSQPERSAEIHQGLVQTYTMLGMEEQARESLNWLDEEYAREPSLATTTALAGALAVLHENAQVLVITSAGVESYPESSQLWWFQGEEYFRMGEFTLAEASYDRAVEHASGTDPQWRAVVMRDCAQACAARDPKKAIKLVITSLPLDQNIGTCIVALESGKEHFTPEIGRESLAELDLDPQAHLAGENLLRIFFSMRDVPQNNTNATTTTLESHVRQMLARCAAHGATPILLTYPMPTPHVESVVRKLARETGVSAVEMQPLFAAASQSNPNVDLFVPDGHCADGGYEIMGRAAAEVAARMFTNQPSGG